MISNFEGKVYDIPEEKLDELSRFIKDEWEPTLNQGLMSDSGMKKIPRNVKALSFTLFLKDWYKNNFSQYEVA